MSFCIPLRKFVGPLGGEVGVGGHGEGDVPVPAFVPSHLVVVETALALGSLECSLDCPAGARDTDDLVRSGPGGRVDDAVGDLVRGGEAAAGQDPVLSARPAERADFGPAQS